MTAADAAAGDLGVRVDIPTAKVQALVAGLTIRDAEALERLTLWVLQRIAPSRCTTSQASPGYGSSR